MTDLAKLASKIVAGVKTDTTDESIIALQLRALWDEAQTKAIKDATEQMKRMLDANSIGGGDK